MPSHWNTGGAAVRPRQHCGRVAVGLARPLIVRAVLRRPKGARFRRVVVHPHDVGAGEAHLEGHCLGGQLVDNPELVAGTAGAQLVVQGAAATHGSRLWRAADAVRLPRVQPKDGAAAGESAPSFAARAVAALVRFEGGTSGSSGRVDAIEEAGGTSDEKRENAE